jgi:hypothetical protein
MGNMRPFAGKTLTEILFLEDGSSKFTRNVCRYLPNYVHGITSQKTTE